MLKKLVLFVFFIGIIISMGFTQEEMKTISIDTGAGLSMAFFDTSEAGDWGEVTGFLLHY